MDHTKPETDRIQRIFCLLAGYLFITYDSGWKYAYIQP